MLKFAAILSVISLAYCYDNTDEYCRAYYPIPAGTAHEASESRNVNKISGREGFTFYCYWGGTTRTTPGGRSETMYCDSGKKAVKRDGVGYCDSPSCGCAISYLTPDVGSVKHVYDVPSFSVEEYFQDVSTSCCV